jgi:SAM-dependent methyltransferase
MLKGNSLPLERKYKECYEKRALDNFEEKDKSRHSRVAFYFRYCVPLEGNDLILDVGAADGIVIEKFRKFEERGIGCDIARTYCLKMRDKGIQSVCCSAEYLPFRRRIFGIIVVSAVLEHVLSLKKCIDEIVGSVKNGGIVLVNVPYLEDLTPYRYCKYEFSHMRSFDEEVLLKLFRNLSLIRVYYHDFSFIFKPVISPLLNRILGMLYAALPIMFKHFLLETRWTRWMKPFSMTVILRKVGV